MHDTVTPPPPHITCLWCLYSTDSRMCQRHNRPTLNRSWCLLPSDVCSHPIVLLCSQYVIQMHKIFFSVCNRREKKVLETLKLGFDIRATEYGPHTDTKVSPLSPDDMPKLGYSILAMRLRSARSLWVEGQWGAFILLVQRGGVLGGFACTLSCTVSWKRAAGHSMCKLSEEFKSEATAKTTGPHRGLVWM